MRTFAFICAFFVAAQGCTCKQTVREIAPSLRVTPTGLDFGQVKTGRSAARTLKLEAMTNAAVSLSSVSLSGDDAVFFTLDQQPTQVAAQGNATIALTFAPTELRAYVATLVLVSNDPEHPTLRVALAGEGAHPLITVRPDCAPSRNCTGTVTATPPEIDFGAEPMQRLVELDATRLPTVFVTNDGPVALVVKKVAIEGVDAAAFKFAGNANIPSAGATFESMGGFNAAIRFKPTSEQQPSYRALLVIESDDPLNARVTVDLKGTLRPNLPPVVCANLVRVVPPPEGDGPRDYSSTVQWDQVRTAPPGGYDFRGLRDVRPGELAIFSAISDAADALKCTFDPEDGRTQVTFSWSLVEAPAGALGLPVSGASSAQAQLRPVVTGEYVLELTARDVQQHATTARARFAVAIKQDLVAQLQWTGAADVDLDVHLVRPSAVPDGGDAFSGVFSPFSTGVSGKTSGDINGYAVTTQRAMPASGFDFDWGGAGSSDDPRLNVDDTGSGPLLENVSLNLPENDGRCASAPCTYGVFVHYFKDARMHSPQGCFVDGGTDCRDGEPCACSAGARCVADGAPVGDAGLGTGKCFPAPRPVVRLFFHGSATAANVIPLDLTPPDDLAIGAPCQVLHVANIEWPRKGALLLDGGFVPPVVTVPGADSTGRVTAPSIARFGWRQTGGSLQCTPDLPLSGVQWYSRQAR